MTDVPNLEAGARAMPIRSPLLRHGAWVTDGIWVAHHSHPIFGRLHAYCPTNGWWSLGPDGPTAFDRPRPIVNLAERVETFVANMRPAVVDDIPDAVVSSMDDIDPDDLEASFIVVDSRTGDAHRFNAALCNSAGLFTKEWGWQIADHDGMFLLVGTDRKGRPRFLLPAIVTTARDLPEHPAKITFYDHSDPNPVAPGPNAGDWSAWVEVYDKGRAPELADDANHIAYVTIIGLAGVDASGRDSTQDVHIFGGLAGIARAPWPVIQAKVLAHCFDRAFTGPNASDWRDVTAAIASSWLVAVDDPDEIDRLVDGIQPILDALDPHELDEHIKTFVSYGHERFDAYRFAMSVVRTPAGDAIGPGAN